MGWPTVAHYEPLPALVLVFSSQNRPFQFQYDVVYV